MPHRHRNATELRLYGMRASEQRQIARASKHFRGHWRPGTLINQLSISWRQQRHAPFLSETRLYCVPATYVDRILRGAKPAELPVQRPRKFEMVLNLKTAKALELAVPPLIRLRTDEVIE
jgi:hypothetical protein